MVLMIVVVVEVLAAPLEVEVLVHMGVMVAVTCPCCVLVWPKVPVRPCLV